MSSIWIGCWSALVASACFSEAPPAADDGTTGGSGCAIGSEGCFCTAGQGCDAGLECLLPVGVCVAEDCTPGAALCECADGSCADSHECVQNVCVPTGSETFSTSDVPGTGTTSDAPTTSGPADSTGVPTSSATLDTSATFTEVSTDPTTDSVGSSTGVASTCSECIEHVQSHDCKVQWDDCTGCERLYQCFVAGLDAGVCCPAEGDPLPIAWQAFGFCVDAQCDDLCDPIACV